MTENKELAIHREENFALGRLMPQSVKELAWFAGEAVKSGMFTTSAGGRETRPLQPVEAFVLMSTGVELGLTPMQALRELSLIKGKVDVPPAVLAAKIAEDPRVTMFDPIGDDKSFTIRAKRRDRENECVVTIAWEDIAQADQSKHSDHREDFLYARCVRRITKRYFPDLKFGLSASVEAERVVDVAAVERKVGPLQTITPCEKCGANTFAHPSGNGGMYNECNACGHRQSPSQAVRDAIRGRVDDFIDMPESTVDPAAGNEGRDLTPEEEAQLEVPTEPAPEQTPVEDEVPAVQVDEEPVDRRSVGEQFHDNVAEVVLNYIAGTKGGERAKAVTAITNLGWTDKDRVGTWVRKLTSESLTLLVEQFGLKVSIKGMLEADIEERSTSTDSAGPVGEGVAVGAAGSGDRAADAG